MKTTKGGKVMNPTDAYRKELRKKELKRNKKERKKVREVGILKKDPDTLKEQIEKLEAMKADGALDKARKHKKRQLEDTYNLVLKKRKEYESKMREKGEEPVMFSHLGPPRRRTTAEEEEDRVKHPKPEDSVYYHPELNPTGAPPPGKPQMYKSSIGPRIPLSASSSSGAASSSLAELNDVDLSVPPPPPPPPMPHVGEVDLGDGSIIPESLPLPPPPPKPPRPAVADLGTTMPLPPVPPPPPGPPPKEQTADHQQLPPPPAVHKSLQPPPPGTGGLEREKSQSIKSDDMISQEPVQGSGMLPPPPPPGMPLKPVDNLSEGASSKSNTINNYSEMKEPSKILPPPPPPRQQATIPGPPIHPALQQDVLPPGISRIPPPPPDMRPQISAPGISGQQVPPGLMVPLMPRPPYGPPPGHPLMMRPPLPPGPPPMLVDDIGARPYVPQKPSYVKSAASTVVKRPLAQHTPQLTSMVPASVRVRRESAVPKLKPKPPLSSAAAATLPKAAPAVAKKESGTSSSALKPQSIDDSYMAFLEDMKALGALDS
ncbi:hypothetical protein DCAR_0518888 [Daucus carota subsp. sativus]|uniref:Wbp11/ELF5/Saf1 N-terminal domain-containing protein n=1 Tax=Daucus carota subsp. sativus TaxID=79200 RepID=A0AAF0X4G7_DAUCS|nr:PREDICTED: formin-like protein 5 [Daucus carota subsp. sativus]WOG99535.1 hypothetical protein DCAR_0518888 [Daucus carota subsp. sativus]